MKTTSLAAAGFALLVSIAGCNESPLERDGPSIPSGFPLGELLVARGDSPALYSAARGERSLENVHPFDQSSEDSSVLAARFEQEPTGFSRATALVQIDATSLEERVLVRAGDRESLGPASWSPDGSQIAYRLTTYEVDPFEVHPREQSTDTMCVRPISSSASRCYDQPRRVYSFDWSPDGNLLVAGPGREAVVRLDIASGATTSLISPGGDEALGAALERSGCGRAQQFVLPQWSASGRYVAALVSLDGGSRSYVPAVFTSKGRFVSLAKASGEFPDAFGWAPERDLLAYTVGEAPHRITELYVHDPVTATDRFLSSTGDEGPVIPRIDGLAWSPDGAWIAFSRPQGCSARGCRRR